MRSENSKKSAISALLSNGIKIILSFFSQKLFVMYIGTKLLGLNGLFSNIISMLAITELGLGSAIIYNLYEPIANDNKVKIRQLVEFYKKSYNIIIMIIIIFGIIVLPFLPYFAGGDINNIYLYYLLFISDTLLSYSVAYKVSLINAYQKNYIINIIHIIYLLFMYSVQILLLFVFKSYLAFLIVKIVSRLLENAIISYKYNKMFDWIKNVKKENLDEKVKKDIIAKVKALFFHKISNFLVASTDNLIISKIFGLVTVGLYTNYCMIINSIQTLFQQMFSAIISSIGNLLIEKDNKKSYKIYKCILMINFIIISFCSLSLYFMIEPFISIWLGKQYLLGRNVLLVLILVFYSTGMRNAPNSFKNAAGIFVEDKFIPLIESFVNLAFSIVLALRFGLIGVFIGTFISSLVLHLYSYPKYVYNKIFQKNKFGYIKEQVSLFLLVTIEFSIVFIITQFIHIENIWLQLVVNTCICLFIPNTINYLIFRKTESFKYVKNKMFKRFNKN